MKASYARWGKRLKGLEYRVTAVFAIGALRLLRRLPADPALNAIDKMARTVGPWTGRHRVALDNLRKAFPDKSEAEIAAIASDMWGNMGRLAAEYVFMHKLFDYRPEAEKPGRIEVVGADIFRRLRDKPKPVILCTGHTGNFELLAIAADALDLKISTLFRAPNNPYVARELLSLRKDTMGELVSSRAGAAFSLARILADNGRIGALVDQKFRNGIRNTFFGRECETSPLVPRLARQYDCDIHMGRSIRLPGNRYRLELYEKLELPRTATGEIDAGATAQLINDVVESWVREYPGQWMWFHKRWSLTPKRS